MASFASARLRVSLVALLFFGAAILPTACPLSTQSSTYREDRSSPVVSFLPLAVFLHVFVVDRIGLYLVQAGSYWKLNEETGLIEFSEFNVHAGDQYTYPGSSHLDSSQSFAASSTNGRALEEQREMRTEDCSAELDAMQPLECTSVLEEQVVGLPLEEAITGPWQNYANLEPNPPSYLYDHAVDLASSGPSPVSPHLVPIHEASDRGDAPRRHHPEPALAVLFERYGGVDAALEMLQRSAELNPHDPVIWSDLGNAYRVKGNTERAIHCFESALRLQPHPDFFLNLGGVRFVMGELEEAIRMFNLGLHLNPRHVLLQFSLGNAFAVLGRKEDAARSFEATLRIQPDFAAADQYLRSLKHELQHPWWPTAGIYLGGALFILCLALAQRIVQHYAMRSMAKVNREAPPGGRDVLPATKGASKRSATAANSSKQSKPTKRG